MPYPNWICLLLLVVLPVQSQHITPAPAFSTTLDKLLVAWVDSGDLFTRVNNSEPDLLAENEVIRPYIAPDGKHVAFTRGQGGLPTMLWLAEVGGQSVREIVALDRLQKEGQPLIFAQIDWLDSSILYFNTATIGALGLSRHDDLWRINVNTGEVEHVLSSGQGGAFSISPDANQLALTTPGTYGEVQGKIRFIDTQTDTLHEVLSFGAVSTGAEYRFYPEVFWEADSNAVRVAIPDQDLIYDEGAANPTVLWRLALDSPPEEIGTVEASFFGLPRWSTDAAQLLYLKRLGNSTSNQFELMLAAGNGANPTVYDTGSAGSFGMPDWLPDVSQFIYPQGEPNHYWLGSPDVPPQPLSQPMFSPQFVDNAGLVYVAVSDTSVEMRYLQLDGSSSSLIATLNNPEWVFDALLVE